MNHLYTVIMAGGAGTRFWPASRTARPKQLLPLAGRSGEPLIASTLRRVLPVCPPERVLVVTARHLAEATRAALPELPPENFLGEPAARNTAPCIGWAATTLLRRDPEAVAMVLPSDHFIADEDTFRSTALRAAEAALDWPVATIGIDPTRPDTGLGYIEKGTPAGTGVYEVAKFIEKPDLDRALAFLESGKHVWNSGMFFFRAKAMLDLIAAHVPALAEGLSLIDRAAQQGEEASAVERIFPSLPAISIDYAVMEKADRVAVVPGSFGWSDVGGWQAAWELGDKDVHDNAAPPSAICLDAKGNLVRDVSTRPDDRVIALVGVNDLAVVVTDDAVLVIPRERAQDVRGVIEELKRRKENHRL
jgi:mannose-1-phosphate guanylyltransferase